MANRSIEEEKEEEEKEEMREEEEEEMEVAESDPNRYRTPPVRLSIS